MDFWEMLYYFADPFGVAESTGGILRLHDRPEIRLLLDGIGDGAGLFFLLVR